jgi:hypothetical protein
MRSALYQLCFLHGSGGGSGIGARATDGFHIFGKVHGLREYAERPDDARSKCDGHVASENHVQILGTRVSRLATTSSTILAPELVE